MVDCRPVRADALIHVGAQVRTRHRWINDERARRAGPRPIQAVSAKCQVQNA
jgi:hypothetical protein